MPYYKGSWYSQLPAFGWFDAQDRPGSAAYQVGGRSIPDSQQGIALPSRAGLGKWFNVTPPGGNLPFPMQQTDVGPAPWTGRGVDISAAAAHQMGYTPKSFPTDAAWKIEPRDEPRGLGSPAGMPVQAGDIPDNTTDDAYASGPSGSSGRQQQGPKMPAASLMDMLSGKAPLEFTPRDYAGNQIGIGDAIAQNSNSLVGLGMGLLQPTRPGESAYGNALQGYQTGSVADANRGYRTALLAHQKTQEGRQAAQDKLAQSNWERQFTRNDPANLPSEFTRAARDLGLTPGSPEHTDFAQKFYQTKAGERPTWGVIEEGPTGKVYGWINPAKQTVTAPPGSGQGTSPLMKTDDISGVRKEISSLPEVKRIGEAMPIYHSMIKSAGINTRAADLDFVYGMAKIFDPDSVVREGEMKLAQGAQTLPEDIKSMMSKVAVDGSRLTPEARQRLLDVAEVRMGQLHNSYQSRIKPYSGIAERYRLNPADIMPSMLDMPTREKAAAPATAAPMAPDRPANVPEGSAWSPSRKKWRSPRGDIFDEAGKPF